MHTFVPTWLGNPNCKIFFKFVFAVQLGPSPNEERIGLKHVLICILQVSNPTDEPQKDLIILFFIVSAVSLSMLEFCCYIVFFVHITNHNNNIAANILRREVIKQRNRTNAITMVFSLHGWWNSPTTVWWSFWWLWAMTAIAVKLRQLLKCLNSPLYLWFK